MSREDAFEVWVAPQLVSKVFQKGAADGDYWVRNQRDPYTQVAQKHCSGLKLHNLQHVGWQGACVSENT